MPQAYPHVQAVADPAAQQSLRLLWDRVYAITGRNGVGTTFLAGPSMGGNPITNLADPTSAQDAVTLNYLQQHYGAAALRLQLQANGTFPLDVSGLPGTTVQTTLIGTHADRLASYPAGAYSIGQQFYETDRFALYVVTPGPQWTLVIAAMVASAAGRPGDLGAADEAFLFGQQDDTNGNVLYYWSGSVWHVIYGMAKGALGSLPAASAANIGLQYWATDFDRIYICNSATTWADAPGQPERFQICFFNQTTVPTGWAKCDGSSVTRSTSTGGTASYATPNLIGSNYFIRSASTPGGTGGSNTQSSTTVANTTGNMNAPGTFQNGTGANFNAGDHTHNVPSLTVNSWDNRPAFFDLLPMVRL